MATRMMPVTPAPIAFRLVWNPCAILTVPFPTVLDSLWKEEIKSRANRTAPTTSNRMPMPRTTALTRRDFIDDACGSNETQDQRPRALCGYQRREEVDGK